MCVRGSRNKILICAREMFHEGGYQSTSVDDILRRTGVARSNFYYHFRSKEELVDAVLEMQTAEYAALLLGSLCNPQLEPFRRLEHFCNQVCLIQAESESPRGCPFGNFAAAMVGDDERMERFRVSLCAAFAQIEDALHACFKDGADRGEFRNDVEPGELATFALAALEGLMILARTHRKQSVLTGGLEVMQQILKVVRADILN